MYPMKDFSIVGDLIWARSRPGSGTVLSSPNAGFDLIGQLRHNPRTGRDHAEVGELEIGTRGPCINNDVLDGLNDARCWIAPAMTTARYRAGRQSVPVPPGTGAGISPRQVAPGRRPRRAEESEKLLDQGERKLSRCRPRGQPGHHDRRLGEWGYARALGNTRSVIMRRFGRVAH